MLKLSQSVNAWQTVQFNAVCKQEISELKVEQLPLQTALRNSSYVSDSGFSVMLIHYKIENKIIKIKAGIFFKGIIAGCNCADDPSPIDEETEYCELLFLIDIETAKTTVSISE